MQTLVPTEILNAPQMEGDPRQLLVEIGTSAEVVSLDSYAGTLDNQHVRSLPELRRFLEDYQTRVLLPLDWPAILRGWQHVSKNELRELIALDQSLAKDTSLRPFAKASCKVGQRQLSRLRPMRDSRFIQRYLRAIEAGQALGWHTLVFGISLQIFSLPLRQGLLHYAAQTTQGFILGAARPLRLSGAQCSELFEDVSQSWPVALETTLAANQASKLIAI